MTFTSKYLNTITGNSETPLRNTDYFVFPSGTDREEIIDTLYQSGALDDSLVRRAVVYEVFYDTLATSSQSTRSVEWDLAMQYDMSRSTVQYIVRRGVA